MEITFYGLTREAARLPNFARYGVPPGIPLIEAVGFIAEEKPFRNSISVGVRWIDPRCNGCVSDIKLVSPANLQRLDLLGLEAPEIHRKVYEKWLQERSTAGAAVAETAAATAK